ncbi:MAG: amino acid permease [Planctomycetes bacterium]|jgi:APA family basic amino acid/polyamine antiporter|nr:amino acid permease [Planctomycetota bacterium]
MVDANVTRTRELSRELGLITAIACGVGSMIGSGIFKKPGLMATQVGSPELLVVVWIVAGAMTLFGALSIAEISGMFRDPGGQYVYFNKGFNRFVGYLYGWATFVVIQSGSIASIAYVFSDSLGSFVHFPRLPVAWEQWGIPIPWIGQITPFKFFGLKLCTIALIVFLTGINYLGVKLGGIVQVVFAVLKVTIILSIVVLAFALGDGHVANLTQSAPGLGAGPAGSSPVFLLIVMAMAGAFWAYDGWINVTYMSGEIRNVQRDLPRAMGTSVLIVIGVYILINLAYIYILPVPEMARRYCESQAAGGSYIVAIDVADSFLGRRGAAVIAVAIMVSTFGAVNGSTMMSARVYFAMARERLFFRRLGEVHPRFHTPANSLLAQGTWASLLVLSGTFDQLTDMLIFVNWIFYALAAVGVFMLRKRMPDTPRPYRVWGYPVTPILFITFASVFIVFTLYTDIQSYRNGTSPLVNSLMGLVWVAAGIPGYLLWSRRKS